MNAEIWAAIGTIAATLVLLIVPGLVYTWYALEHLIGDRNSYESVIAQSNGGPCTDPCRRDAPSKGERRARRPRRTGISPDAR
jgi:hypothetical protein